METETLVQPYVFMELSKELWEAATATATATAKTRAKPTVNATAGGRVCNADLIRSEENILRWMAYLPQDCVETMIRMGWDVTT
jgi:hypothetical protein